MSDTTIAAPPTGNGVVRTLADVAAIVDAAGLAPGMTHWWRGPRVRVHCWPSVAFQVAVYALDGDEYHLWSAIFDYETPAAVIAATIAAAQGGAA